MLIVNLTHQYPSSENPLVRSRTPEIAFERGEYGVVGHHAEENIAETRLPGWKDSGQVNECNGDITSTELAIAIELRRYPPRHLERTALRIGETEEARIY